MKRSGFKKKPYGVYIGLKRTGMPLRGSKLRIKGISSSAQLKDEIQGLVRAIVMARDQGCILRNIRHCNPQEIQQADHLVTRSNNATYADTRLIVNVCRGCHLWKKYNKEKYEMLVKPIIGTERTELWATKEAERLMGRTTHMTAGDWKVVIFELKDILATYTKKVEG